MFHWVNTVLGNVKTSLSGAHHSFGFSRYAERYLGAIAYRFKRPFHLHAPGPAHKNHQPKITLAR
jgi:hypothetical protein